MVLGCYGARLVLSGFRFGGVWWVVKGYWGWELGWGSYDFVTIERWEDGYVLRSLVCVYYTYRRGVEWIGISYLWSSAVTMACLGYLLVVWG